MRTILKKLTALTITTACIAGSLFQMPLQPVQAETVMTDEEKIATIQDPIETKDGKVATSYLYFGSYPQSEVTGAALTEEIKNAEYDEKGDAVVDGQKYRRLCEEDAYYTKKEVIESGLMDYKYLYGSDFFEWTDVNNGYRYYRYEPIKWQVYSVSGESAVLISDEILDHRSYSEYGIEEGWVDASVRCWLNGCDAISEKDLNDYKKDNFVHSAFSVKEQQALIEVGTRRFYEEDMSIRYVAWDKVRLAYHDEVSEFATYDRQKRLTDYAIAMGIPYNDPHWWTMREYNIYPENYLWYVIGSGAFHGQFHLDMNFDYYYKITLASPRDKLIGIVPRIMLDLSQTDLWMTECEYEQDQEQFTIEDGTLTKINPWYGGDGLRPAEEIVIPDTVESTGSYLLDRHWLEVGRIVLPSSLKKIGDNAFYKRKLAGIDFSEGLKNIGVGAFEETTIQNLYTLPSTLEFIEEGAFRNSCQPDFVLPDGLISIDANAFMSMQSGTRKQMAASGSALDVKYTKWDCMYIPESVENILFRCFDQNVVLLAVKGSKAESYIKQYGYRGIILESAEECRQMEQYLIEGRKYPVFDVNRDEKVTLADASEVLKETIGIESEKQVDYVKLDANQSGNVDLSDANLVLKAALGIE